MTQKGGRLSLMEGEGQKDELDTHSRPDSISVIVHYGGERTNDPRAISEHDIVLTTCLWCLSICLKKWGGGGKVAAGSGEEAADDRPVPSPTRRFGPMGSRNSRCFSDNTTSTPNLGFFLNILVRLTHIAYRLYKFNRTYKK